MKRALLLSLALIVLVSVVVLCDPVWVNPQLWDQDVLKLTPAGSGYPVLAITQVIDGGTFEALLYIAPQVITAVDVRVALQDGSYVGHPGDDLRLQRQGTGSYQNSCPGIPCRCAVYPRDGSQLG